MKLKSNNLKLNRNFSWREFDQISTFCFQLGQLTEVETIAIFEKIYNNEYYDDCSTWCEVLNDSTLREIASFIMNFAKL